MSEKTTRGLSKILEQVKDCSEADQFIDAYKEREFTYFYEYLNWMIGVKGLTTSEVVAASGISRNYVYNILNGDKKNPGRDKVIALCIGAEMNYSQTQRGLEIAKAAPLYPKDERDVRIAVAINKGIRSVTEVNLLLDQCGVEPLKV
ncbi:helix-turn-helix transcriptional regulator [Anaerovoracaceae bacterium 41-7]|jgi:transcriptional regulator with XRE-family HTH domain|uniref:helix-turn-helix domain-containing protein n=1 Tax=Anaerovoracaceae TaxID=543314 RepID=UPI0013796681|nr:MULTISPECIES: helix-turn-helix transcriptional regulator [Clostridia]NCE98514.1 hypothetical protein [Emergencia sp. 1XD21-10]